MQTEQTGADLSGQAMVFESWRQRLHGRDFIAPEDLDLSGMIAELAHVSVLERTSDGFCFRLAGSGLRWAFGCESRGLYLDEIEKCCDQPAWTDAPAKTLARVSPSAGRTRLADGTVHFWIRLPMSSDGVNADLVLCHDRYLPPEALIDPDRAARTANQALRLDSMEMQAA
jgi:hypothetical protein